MRLEMHRQPDRDERVYTLVIDGADLHMARFTKFDWALFDDVNRGQNVTIADQLLALETMARRIEEAHEMKGAIADDATY